MLNYDLIRNCQAQSGSLRFRCKEWIKNVLSSVRRYSDTGIPNLKLNILYSRLFDPPHFYCDHPATFSCLDSVQHNVYQHLANLIDICQDSTSRYIATLKGYLLFSSLGTQ